MGFVGCGSGWQWWWVAVVASCGLFPGWSRLMMVLLGWSSLWAVEFNGGFGCFVVGLIVCEMGFYLWVWLFCGCGFKCLAMSVNVCGCFMVVKWLWWVNVVVLWLWFWVFGRGCDYLWLCNGFGGYTWDEIFYIILICCMLKIEPLMFNIL